MRWQELTIDTTEEAVEGIADRLHELGAGGVSIEESGSLNRKRDTSLGQWYELPLNDIPEGRAVIKAYFAEGTEMSDILPQVKATLGAMPDFGIDTGEPKLELAEVDDEDWANAWKAYFKPLRITPTLTVKPTWEEYSPSAEERIIELDPGMAFGTGTHPTTALCLKVLEETVRPDDEVVDIGTGSGILAVAAVKLGARHVLAVDLDPMAVTSARQNAELNQVDGRITVLKSDLFGAMKQGSKRTLGVEFPVRVVVANILAEIILLCIRDAYEALAPGGVFIASGIIESKQDLVEQALRKAGFDVFAVDKEQDWVAVRARRN